MARNHATILSAIWSDPDFNALPSKAQWLYLLLLSQRDLSSCGVLPSRPKMWARFTSDLDRSEVEDAALLLDERGFVVLDVDTDEILVRTFMRHDGITRSPNMLKSAARQFGAIHSERIQSAILAELPKHLRAAFPGEVLTLHPSAISSLISRSPEPADQGKRENTAPSPLPTEGFPEGFPEPLLCATTTTTKQPPPTTTRRGSRTGDSGGASAHPDPVAGGGGGGQSEVPSEDSSGASVARVAAAIGQAAAERDNPKNRGSYAAAVTRKILSDPDRAEDRRRISEGLASGLPVGAIVQGWWDPPASDSGRTRAKQLEDQTQTRLKQIRETSPGKPNRGKLGS